MKLVKFLGTPFLQKTFSGCYCLFPVSLEAATRGVLGVLRSFAKLTGKYLCQSLFFNKVAGLRPLLKKRLWYRCFPVNFAKFLRTPFLQNTSGRLLLQAVQLGYFFAMYSLYICVKSFRSTLNLKKK